MRTRPPILILVIAALLGGVQYGQGQQDAEHPRLFFDREALPTLRVQAETTHHELWASVLEFAQTQRHVSPPTEAPVSDDLDVYRGYGDMLVPLAFVCAVGGDSDDCATARRFLLTITAWEQWDRKGERDLGFGHILFGSALAYDWLYGVMPPEERAVVRTNIARHAEALYAASTQPYNADWNNWWAGSFMQNHHWINNAALGMAGLALLGEDVGSACQVTAAGRVNLRERPGTDFAVGGTLEAGESVSVVGRQGGADGRMWWLLEDGRWVREDVVAAGAGCAALVEGSPQHWLDQATAVYARLHDFWEGMEDGTWHEGILYQDYGLTMALPFLINLRRLHGVDWLPHTYLARYAQWRMDNLLPGSAEFLMAYGDLEWWWGNARATGLLRFAAAEYDDSAAEWTAQQIAREIERGADIWTAPWMVYEFLYYDPRIRASAPADAAVSRVYADLEGVIWRTGWDSSAILFGLKTGAYGGRFAYETFIGGLAPWAVPCEQTGCKLNVGHDHEDANSFTLYAGGAWLAPEVQGENNRPTTFHNTLLIDGQGQTRPPDDVPVEAVRTDGTLLAAASLHFDYVAADAARRYVGVGGISQVTRQVVFVRPGYLLMIDRVAADAPHRYEWLCHFGEVVRVEGDWVRGDGGDWALGVGVLSPGTFTGEIGDDGRPYIRISPTADSPTARFVNLLVPTPAQAWDSRPTALLLGESDSAVAVRVNSQDGSEGFDDILIVDATADQPSQMREIGAYYFDGRVAVLRRRADGSLTGMFLFGGTMLASFATGGESGRVLAANLDPITAFEAVYDGDNLMISTAATRQITVYAPAARQVGVNGTVIPTERRGEYVLIPPTVSSEGEGT